METNNVTPEIPNGVRKLNNKQYILVLMGVFLLFVFGLLIYNLGGFKKEQSTLDENNVNNIAPPTAKPKELEKDKYKNGVKDASSGGDISKLRSITGKEVEFKKESNENLSDDDLARLETKQTNSRSIKAKMNRNYQQNIQREQETQRYIASNNTPLYRKTKEELEEERLDNQERAANARTAELVLKNLEKVNSQPYTQATISQEPVVLKKDLKETKPKQSQTTEILIRPEITPNSIGNPFKKGFYTYNTTKKGSYSVNDGIPAVIHGQSDGITASNGTIIKLRLLENTVLEVNNEKVNLVAGTLLSGISQVGDDRVMIYITALQYQNAIYPVNVAVFDLDGQMGLYVPNLRDKNTLSREITNAANRPFSGTSLFIPGGSIQQQVGTQVALQATQSLMNSAKSYVRVKTQNPKVSIKPNYKVLLKSVNLNLNTQTNENE